MKKILISLTIIQIYFITLVNTNAIKVKKSYTQKEKVNLISGTVNSFKTQIPYDLYYLDICAPEDISLIQNNLGERLLSGKSYQTAYELSINQTKKCQLLCKKKISKTAYKRINDLIKKEYFVNYFLDNLPVGLAHTFYNINTKKIKYNTGIPIGFVKDGQTYINNYYRINIELNAINIPVLKNKTNRDDDDEYFNITGYDIIGFTMEPYSIKVNETNKCQNDRIIRSKT
jgi:hypothetical protein